VDMDRPQEQSGESEPRVDAKVEREVALRMIASRAAIDQDYLDMLRDDPAAAVAALNVSLSESDMQRFKSLNWEAIQGYLDALRKEVGMEHMLRGAW
jgi:hypothetical protein